MVDSIYLWSVTPDQCQNPALLRAYQTFLTPQEQHKQARFYHQRDRHRYLVSRVLLKVVLSQWLQVAPQSLVFTTTEHGKPLLTAPYQAIVTQLSFNLTHTDDLVLLAVSTQRALGVDAESIQREAPLEVGLRYFSPHEIQTLECLPTYTDKVAFFWSLWTLKESLIKATGLGLSTPLERFSFALQAHHIALSCAPNTPEAATPWWFGQWCPSAQHLAALCVEHTQHTSASPPHIEARHIIPLEGEQPQPIHFLRTSTVLEPMPT